MTARALRMFSYVLAFLILARPAAAQPLGTYSWQMTPYCNVLVLAATQLGSQYRLEGYDDQCGAGPRAAVTGLVVPNTDGTLEFGLTIVSATSAAPAHIDVTFTIATLGGPWRDSAGNSGTLVFGPVSPSGPPRPNGFAASSINPNEIQRRVGGACAAGQFLQGVNADGTVVCGADASSGGTITGVTAGAGLVGGGTTGAVALDVVFAGTGASATAARADHTHAASGINNTSVGESAFTSITTGINNTAVGAQSLQGVTSGTGNTGVGSQALRSMVSGSANTAVGFFSLSNTTANSNTAVGSGSLFSDTTGSSNTAVGGGALINNTTASNNTAVGGLALTANTTGAGNSAFGSSALDANTTGSSNIAIGQNALGANSVGGSNVAVGTSAMAANLASNNVAAGFEAMLTNSTGTLNTAVGYRALRSNTTALSNVAVGANALELLTNSSDNTAVGAGALALHTSGFGNVAIGADALAADTVSSANVAVGQSALESMVVGNDNVAIGYSALRAATSGTNVALGYFALGNTVSGTGNTGLGYGALIGTTGSNNLAIGYNAGSALTTGSNNIAIDSSGSSGESNTTRIGGGQTRAFISGIRGIATGVANAVAVLIDSNGQLGTASSSRRFKDDIADLGDVGLKLQRLRPVQFRYKAPYADGSYPLQFGLIAEEVNEVLPELVARNADGEIETVQYHVLPTLLLAEVQRLERERVAAARAHDQAIGDLQAQIAELRQMMARMTSAAPR